MAINTKKCAENEQKRRNSVSSETGTPSSKNPQTIVGNDGKGFRSYSPDDAPSQIGLPPLPASISKQNLEPMAKLSLSWISPLQNLAKPLVYTPETFQH